MKSQFAWFRILSKQPACLTKAAFLQTLITQRGLRVFVLPHFITRHMCVDLAQMNGIHI